MIDAVTLMRWTRALPLAAAITTLPLAAAAQVVTVPNGPVEPGRDVTFMIQVPAGQTIDEVILDPLPLGGPDTFVHRSRRGDAFGPCPHPTTCYIGFTVDIRAEAGPRTIPITVTVDGRARMLTGRFEVSTRRKDFDGDGLPDAWEEAEGLSTMTGEGHDGADGDKDGDGVRNIDEYRAGTPPSARHVRWFGDSSPGDRQHMAPCFLFGAPGQRYGAAWGRVRLIGDDGRRRETSALVWQNGSACPLRLDRYVADRVLAVEVETLSPTVVEREMVVSSSALPSWIPNATAIHGSTPVDAATDWHFAEGPSRRPVDVFLLAYNPGAVPVNATFTYYRSAGEAPIVATRRLAPGRTTTWVNADEPTLTSGDFAVSVHADAPILVDRGLRWNPPGRTAPQESVHSGVTVLSEQWLFAAVDASRSSDDRLVLANPGGEASLVDVAVFTRAGEPHVFRYELGATTRLALRAADFGADDGLVAVRFRSANAVPFVAEHTQEGTRTPSGRWAFATPGITETGTAWAPIGTDPIVLVNPSERAADVQIVATTTEDFGPARLFSVVVPAGRLAIFSPREQGSPTIASVVVRSQSPDGVAPATPIAVARAAQRVMPGQGVVRTEAIPATRLP